MSWLSVFLWLSAGLWLLVAGLAAWSAVEVVRFDKNNCLYWALPRWVQRASEGEPAYLVIRLTFIKWGFLHFLSGRYDPETDQIVVTSYRPPAGHVKTRFAPTFRGRVVGGDAPPSVDRQSKSDL